MNFCEKCGLRLEDEGPNCINCRNTSLIDQEKEGKSAETHNSINLLNSKQQLSNTVTDLASNNSQSELPPVNCYARLSVIKGGTEGREFPLTSDICNIGRWDPSLQSHPEIDLSDEDIDAKVSRLHARIIRKPEGYYIEDTGSRNGTFLNREFRLVQGIEYSLKDKDEVIIGHIFFQFQMD